MTDIFGNSENSVATKGEEALSQQRKLQALKNMEWPEKYRPDTLDSMLLPVELKAVLKNAIAEGTIDNMVFYSGNPGTGKTSTAIAICKELKCDFKFINASLHGNIGTLKGEIEGYGMQKIYGTSKVRVVILDEVDGATSDDFFTSLRGLIDKTANTLRFILTCNSLHKIPGNIQSRCKPISFAYGNEDIHMKKIMFKRLKEIAIGEVGPNGTVEDETLKMIARNHFPDFRCMLRSLQYNFRQNNGSIKGVIAGVSHSSMETIWKLLINGNWENARHTFNASISDYSSFYRTFLEYMLSVADQKYRMDLAQSVAEYQFRATFQVDQEINISCGLFPAIVKVMKS